MFQNPNTSFVEIKKLIWKTKDCAIAITSMNQCMFHDIVKSNVWILTCKLAWSHVSVLHVLVADERKTRTAEQVKVPFAWPTFIIEIWIYQEVILEIICINNQLSCDFFHFNVIVIILGDKCWKDKMNPIRTTQFIC